MSENKRFELDDEAIIDNVEIADDGGRQIYWTVEYIQRERLVELLNKLNDENEQLKSCSDKLQKELIKKVEEKAKLKTENQGLQFKIIDMLDFVKDKGTVTREEIKEWWNNSQRGDNLCSGYVAREDK